MSKPESFNIPVSIELLFRWMREQDIDSVTYYRNGLIAAKSVTADGLVRYRTAYEQADAMKDQGGCA